MVRADTARYDREVGPDSTVLSLRRGQIMNVTLRAFLISPSHRQTPMPTIVSCYFFCFLAPRESHGIELCRVFRQHLGGNEDIICRHVGS